VIDWCCAHPFDVPLAQRCTGGHRRQGHFGTAAAATEGEERLQRVGEPRDVGRVQLGDRLLVPLPREGGVPDALGDALDAALEPLAAQIDGFRVVALAQVQHLGVQRRERLAHPREGVEAHDELAAHRRLEDAPAAAVVGALVEQGVDAVAQVTQPWRRLPRQARRLVRGEAHGRRDAHLVDGDRAKLGERGLNIRRAPLHAKEDALAVEFLGPLRDLLELQHGGADGGGVQVAHDLERPLEGGLLGGCALCAGWLLVQRREVPEEGLDVRLCLERAAHDRHPLARGIGVARGVPAIRQRAGTAVALPNELDRLVGGEQRRGRGERLERLEVLPALNAIPVRLREEPLGTHEADVAGSKGFDEAVVEGGERRVNLERQASHAALGTDLPLGRPRGHRGARCGRVALAEGVVPGELRLLGRRQAALRALGPTRLARTAAAAAAARLELDGAAALEGAQRAALVVEAERAEGQPRAVRDEEAELRRRRPWRGVHHDRLALRHHLKLRGARALGEVRADACGGRAHALLVLLRSRHLAAARGGEAWPAGRAAVAAQLLGRRLFTSWLCEARWDGDRRDVAHVRLEELERELLRAEGRQVEHDRVNARVARVAPVQRGRALDREDKRPVGQRLRLHGLAPRAERAVERLVRARAPDEVVRACIEAHPLLDPGRAGLLAAHELDGRVALQLPPATRVHLLECDRSARRRQAQWRRVHRARRCDRAVPLAQLVDEEYARALAVACSRRLLGW